MKTPKISYENTKVIDQAKTAASAREFRAANKGVLLSHVAIELDLSITHISLLERGTRTWTKDVYDAYIAAVKKWAKRTLLAEV